MSYDASDRKQVRAAEKLARNAERDRQLVVAQLCSTTSGREWIWNKLEAAHIFHTSYNENPIAMAFAEGERNQGLQLLGDVMAACPEQFLEMMREANVRRTLADTRANTAAADGTEGRSDASTEPEPGAAEAGAES